MAACILYYTYVRPLSHSLLTRTGHRQSIVFDTTLPVFRNFTVALSSVSPNVK